jgi:hypothetical protein
MLIFELDSGRKSKQQVTKLSFRDHNINFPDHNITIPEPFHSSSKYHTIFPNYAQVFQAV